MLIALALAGSASPQSGSIALDAQTVLSGSTLTIGNPCSRLSADIGQPAPGYSSGGVFTLSAGFLYTVPATSADTIFFGGMEVCAP